MILIGFMELTMVNVQCSRQLSFTTLIVRDDLYRVVVSESKLDPTEQNWGL